MTSPAHIKNVTVTSRLNLVTHAFPTTLPLVSVATLSNDNSSPNEAWMTRQTGNEQERFLSCFAHSYRKAAAQLRMLVRMYTYMYVHSDVMCVCSHGTHEMVKDSSPSSTTLTITLLIEYS